MARHDLAALLIAFVLVASVLACQRREGAAPGERDTLTIKVPEDIDESLERGARTIGGKVGEALEQTGEAIEKAGERLREEAGEPVRTGDTL